MAAPDEQESLLKSFYANETDPNSKGEAQTGEKKEESVSPPPLVSDGFPPVTAIGTPPAQSPDPRSSWSTSLFACLGNNDEFFTSDLEVCVLGTCAPCLLYASNAERLHPTTENTFTHHFLAYSGLLCLGNLFFGFNALAPCFSCANRTEMRQRFNLMGSGECFARSCGCGSCVMEGEKGECVEAVADFATHYLCHQCALCQEGREVRRRMPHPGFIRSYVAATMNAPPAEQSMSA